MTHSAVQLGQKLESFLFLTRGNLSFNLIADTVSVSFIKIEHLRGKDSRYNLSFLSLSLNSLLHMKFVYKN